MQLWANNSTANSTARGHSQRLDFAAPRHSSLVTRRGPQGATGLSLIEMLVTLLILSILAAAALPYAELTVKRDKELELKRALREMRSAIDAFHEDWQAGRIPQFSDVASEDGYPGSLEVLVDGVDLATAAGKRKVYLRRVPRNPFAARDQRPGGQWHLRSYQDAPDANVWGGQDVYDVRHETDRKAIDGSDYRDW